MYIHLYDETKGNKETQALSAEHCLRQVQENKQIIINEEGSKEEERQEDASVNQKKKKRIYTQILNKNYEN